MSKRTFDEMSTGNQYLGLTAFTGALFDSDLYSDMVISCKGKVWKAHKVVVCLQSKPFAAAFKGGFEEAQTGIIKLDDHDPEIVDYMLKFMYTGNYALVPKPQPIIAQPPAQPTPQPPSKLLEPATETFLSKNDPRDLLAHTYVYLLADEKDISVLKILAKKKYEAALPHCWNSEAFASSLKIIYEQTPESDRMLRDAAIRYAGIKGRELMDRGEFVALFKENGEIGVDVFNKYLELSSKTMPTFVLAAGCPWFGEEHNEDVTRASSRSRLAAYYCSVCKKYFDT